MFPFSELLNASCKCVSPIFDESMIIAWCSVCLIYYFKATSPKSLWWSLSCHRAGLVAPGASAHQHESNLNNRLQICQLHLKKVPSFKEVIVGTRILWYLLIHEALHMGVSKNNGTPKSSILIEFSTINHPIWGTPNFWKHPYSVISVHEES